MQISKTNSPSFTMTPAPVAAALAGILPAFILLLLTGLLFLFLFYVSPTTAPLPPGPKPLPIVGNLLDMLGNKPQFRWVLRVAGGKDITCIRVGGVHLVVVNSPELAREFLTKHDASFASRPLTMATEYSGRGFRSVVVAPMGDQWKKMRRVIASGVVSQSRLNWLAGMREEEADELVRYIFHRCANYSVGNMGEAAVIDVRLTTRYYSGNVIRRMLFGRRHFGKGARDSGPGPGEEEVEHVEAAFAVLSCIYAFCSSDFIPSLRVLDLEGHERVMKESVGVINKYHDPIVEERVRRWRGNAGAGAGAAEGEERKVGDLLDVLVTLKKENGKPVLDMEEIKAQTAELIYAAVDNPSNVVEWTLAEMLSQPSILGKAVDELDRVVGRERLVQESDLANLPYIKACAREGLRLHPVAPFNLPHVSTADTTVAGYFIPKGSQVLLSRIGLGRNPSVWEDPLRFDPERHLVGVEKLGLAEPELRFISFTTGRRGCMGAQLGTLMTCMLLARMLQGFEWAVAPGTEKVELVEEARSLFMAKPLHALAKPRLPLLNFL